MFAFLKLYFLPSSFITASLYSINVSWFVHSASYEAASIYWNTYSTYYYFRQQYVALWYVYFTFWSGLLKSPELML